MPSRRQAHQVVALRSPPLPRSVDLERMSQDALLGTRLCDLGLRFAGSLLEARASVLLDELAQRGIAFRPHMWLSTEWFSPDDVPGFAIPFYLAHPRLLALETQQMGEAEGGSEQMFRRLLRHEAGHVLDTAYRLHERDDWREVFGAWNAPYHRHYQPKPYSKHFVRYLDHWYAQSHPAEDFAETVAVWLDPESSWRTRYRGWPALRKLSYVNRVMREIAHQEPLVRRRERVEPLSEATLTVRAYYEDKRRRYHLNRRAKYERDLKQLFPERGTVATGGAGLETAAQYLLRARPEIRKLVADRTGALQYDIDRVLRGMIERSRQLDLVVAAPPALVPAHLNGRASGHARGRLNGLAHQHTSLTQRVADQLAQYIEEGHHLYVR